MIWKQTGDNKSRETSGSEVGLSLLHLSAAPPGQKVTFPPHIYQCGSVNSSNDKLSPQSLFIRRQHRERKQLSTDPEHIHAAQTLSAPFDSFSFFSLELWRRADGYTNSSRLGSHWSLHNKLRFSLKLTSCALTSSERRHTYFLVTLTGCRSF